MQGVLLVNKPEKWTSFDVVAYVRKIIASEQKVKPAQVKVGHTGTLDPLAKGLLVLLIGKKYTRMASSLTKLDKEYLVEMKLGEVSESHDRETEAKFYSDYQPTENEIKQAFKSFEGRIMQKPPMFSAIKVNGQRAYMAVRQGKEIELKERPVNIYKLELISYKYPIVGYTATVSSGTYIRSLVFDLGVKLKCGAYMTDLTRTKVGKFELSNALEIEKLSYEQIAANLLSLV